MMMMMIDNSAQCVLC